MIFTTKKVVLNLKNWLKFDQVSFRTRGIGPISVLAVFAFALVSEMVLVGLFYAAGLLMGQEEGLQSIVLNIGIAISKLIILYLLYHLLRDARAPVTDEHIMIFKFPNTLGIKRIAMPLMLLTIVIWVGFRTAYDPWAAPFVLQQFGLDPDLVEGVKDIMGAPLLGLLYIIFIGPIYEEIVFRGFLFSGLLKKGYSFKVSAVLTAILFALMHLNWAQGINAFFIGLLAASLYYWTGDLRAAIGLHIMNNALVDLWTALTGEFFSQVNWLWQMGISGAGLILLALSLRYYYHMCKKIAYANA